MHSYCSHFLFIKGCNLWSYTIIEGKGIDVDWQSITKGRRMYFTVISFRYGDSTYITHQPDGVEYFNNYKKGDDAKVIFPFDHPENAKLYGASAYWFNIPSLAILGFILVLVLGVLQMISYGKPTKPWFNYPD